MTIAAETTGRLFPLVVKFIRAPDRMFIDADGAWTQFDFSPPLTATSRRCSTGWSEWLVRPSRSRPPNGRRSRPTIDALRTYHALASPTAAQTASAVKALIRVLRALLRD